MSVFSLHFKPNSYNCVAYCEYITFCYANTSMLSFKFKKRKIIFTRIQQSREVNLILQKKNASSTYALDTHANPTKKTAINQKVSTLSSCVNISGFLSAFFESAFFFRHERGTCVKKKKKKHTAAHRWVIKFYRSHFNEIRWNGRLKIYNNKKIKNMSIFITIYEGKTSCDIHQKMSALGRTVVVPIKENRLRKIVHDSSHFALAPTHRFGVEKSNESHYKINRFSIN